MDTEISPQFKSSHSSVLSPDGAYIATLTPNHLQIRTTSLLQVIRSISIPADHNARSSTVRWAPPPNPGDLSKRFLLADDDTTRIWDIRDEKWSTVISNGSGSMGKIVNVEFGRTENQVLLFSDFCSKVTVWCLGSGRTVEIKDPKFKDRGWDYRPGDSGLFALLSRPAEKDILTIHAPETHAVMRTVMLSTQDAQGLRWSPDGRWLAVWDTPSVGCKVFIYTADGHMYRCYFGRPDAGLQGLGVRSLEWSPGADFLAIGGFEQTATLLGARTFSPAVFLDHTPPIQLTTGTVWQEQATTSTQRAYTPAPQPVSPPTAPSPDTLKTGISQTTFNSTGTLIATHCTAFPTTLWLWDLTTLTPCSIVLQHAPIKLASWNPTIPTLLLILCAQDEPIIYLYNIASSNPPLALPIPFQTTTSKPHHSARWIPTPPDRHPALLFGDTHGAVVVWPEGKDPILRFERPSTPDEESEDSLYEILTGRTSIPEGERGSTPVFTEDEESESVVLEDTFRDKGKWRATQDILDYECF